MLGTGRAADLLRYLRGPSGASPGRVDWFERKLRRDRVQTAAEALRLWEEEHGEPPVEPSPGLREAAGRPADLAAEVAGPRGGNGRSRRRRSWRRAPRRRSPPRWRERAELDGLAPLPEAMAQALAGIAGAGVERTGRGPGQDRRPAPGAGGALRQRLRRLPAGRRVPARRRPHRPVPLRAPARVAGPAAAPRQTRPRSATSSTPAWRCRDGGSSSPTATATRTAPPRRPRPSSSDVRQMLEPSEGEIRGRGLAEVVHRARRRAVGDRAGADDRRRAARAPTRSRLLAAAGAEDALADRVRARLASARDAEAATRAPGPISNPAVIAALGDVHAYGGTTLEGFDVCSYRWFVSHELSPQPLDPAPDPLVQGGIVHAALYSLYKERPEGDALPRPASLATWIARGQELVDEIAAARELGEHPAERAMLARDQGPARPLPRRGVAPRDRRASSPGCWRRGSPSPRRSSNRPRDRRLAPARGDRPGRPGARRARPRPRLQALEQGLRRG